jgi:cell division protein FtsQ
MNRVFRIILMFPSLYLIAMPVFYSHDSYSRPCRQIKITIADSSKYHFVTKRDIQNTMVMSSGGIVGKTVKDLDIPGIEGSLIKYRELKDAEVYMAIDGTMHVYADQRNPIMRLIPDAGGDYYLDNEGVVVRSRNLYAPRLHIVGGDLTITQKMLAGTSVLDTSIKNSILKDIYYLVKFINGDSFWSAQIDQIYVVNRDQIDLVPRVGNHIVHLGTAENFEGKLRNLRVFYDKVMPEVGWNKYSSINLSYKDQIVCKRR